MAETPGEDYANGAQVFFGTGVATPRGVTTGIPLDYLDFFFAAAQMVSLFRGKIVHILADSLALRANPPKKHDDVRQAAQKTEAGYNDLYGRLGMDGRVTLIRSSVIEKDPDYQAIRAKTELTKPNIDTTTLAYASDQLALVTYARQKLGAAMKVSWVADFNAAPKRDERFFDNLYDQFALQQKALCEPAVQNDSLAYYYASGGCSLDKARPKVSPYVLLAEERPFRLAVDSTPAETTEFFDKLDRLSGKALKNVGIPMTEKLQNIVNFYESAWHPLNGNNLRSKVTDMITRLTDTTSPEPCGKPTFADANQGLVHLSLGTGRSISRPRQIETALPH